MNQPDVGKTRVWVGEQINEANIVCVIQLLLAAPNDLAQIVREPPGQPGTIAFKWSATSSQTREIKRRYTKLAMDIFAGCRGRGLSNSYANLLKRVMGGEFILGNIELDIVSSVFTGDEYRGIMVFRVVDHVYDGLAGLILRKQAEATK